MVRRGFGGFEDLNAEEAAAIGRLLRHDGTEARSYFRRLLAGPANRLRTPLTCLIGADDPLTPDVAQGWLNWLPLARDVELVVLAGDHYFVRERPQDTARHLLAALDVTEPDHPEPDHPEPDHPEPDHPEPDHPEPDHPEPDRPEPDHPEPDHPEPDHDAQSKVIT